MVFSGRKLEKLRVAEQERQTDRWQMGDKPLHQHCTQRTSQWGTVPSLWPSTPHVLHVQRPPSNLQRKLPGKQTWESWAHATISLWVSPSHMVNHSKEEIVARWTAGGAECFLFGKSVLINGSWQSQHSHFKAMVRTNSTQRLEAHTFSSKITAISILKKQPAGYLLKGIVFKERTFKKFWISPLC